MPRGLHIIIFYLIWIFTFLFAVLLLMLEDMHFLGSLSRRLFRDEDNDDGTQLLLAIFTLGTNNDDGEDSRAHTARELTDC